VPPATHDILRDPVGSYLEEWEALLASWGERPFRAKQVFRWIHTRSVADPAGMTDIAKTLREKLSGSSMHMPAIIERANRAADDTRKVLVGFPDASGSGTVETVLIPPMPDDDADDELDDEPSPSTPRIAARRVTQCISTQVGCAMGCVFCASGVAGLKRHLTAGEIVAQVLLGRTLLDDGRGDAQRRADGHGRAAAQLRRGGSRAAAAHAPRRPRPLHAPGDRQHLGLVPEIERLGQDFRGEVALAISLHAPTDDIRSQLMPINRRYPLAELMPALRRYPLARRRRITVEYTLIRGVNDQARTRAPSRSCSVASR
jgi:23S rRNA (adenine2503-C2)-methyltransferase